MANRFKKLPSEEDGRYLVGRRPLKTKGERILPGAPFPLGKMSGNKIRAMLNSGALVFVPNEFDAIRVSQPPSRITPQQVAFVGSLIGMLSKARRKSLAEHLSDKLEGFAPALPEGKELDPESKTFAEDTLRRVKLLPPEGVGADLVPDVEEPAKEEMGEMSVDSEEVGTIEPDETGPSDDGSEDGGVRELLDAMSDDEIQAEARRFNLHTAGKKRAQIVDAILAASGYSA